MNSVYRLFSRKISRFLKPMAPAVCSVLLLPALAGAAIDMNQVSSEFAQPGNAWRGKPFWSWNGALKEDELFRQISVLKEMGMGGFFMHSRTGLATEYLGEEWFNLINACADEGDRLGMESWLYDEDRWPSGTAGGLVTANPEYSQKFMSMRTVPAMDFSWKEDIVAAFSCDLEGLRFSECNRIQADTPRSEFAGKTILVFTIESAKPSSFFNGNTEVDRLNRDATEAFIKLTHEKYKEHCGDRLGRSIKGIFTDEPHRGPVFSGFALGNDNRMNMTPWTPKLPEVFQQRFGHDIIKDLPDLFLQRDGEAVAPVKWEYMEIVQAMFLENWCKPIKEWCDRENMIFTGHFLHEDSLTCQAALQGSLMRAYEYENYPGVDVLTEGNRNYWIVKQLSSAARQLGQTTLLSELYGCTGWQFNFESHKAVGDWQALFGINLRCQHLSWYTMGGEAKRDYPASIFFQSGWWKDYHFVEDYYARLNFLLAQGKPACDVLVLNPVESVWCQVGVGWADVLTPKTKAIEDLEKAYQEMFFFLAGSHIDFDYGDEEMLGRLGSIDKGGDVPVLRFGKAAYRSVIVPKMTTIRESSLSLLKAFAAAGGNVVFAGDAPAYVNAVASEAPAQLATATKQVAWDRDAVAGAVKASIQTPVEIVKSSGALREEIFYQLRDAGDTKILVTMNTHTEKDYNNILLRVKAEGSVSEWNCLTGDRWRIDAQTHDGWTEFTADFPPSGEHVFLITEKPIPGLNARPKLEEVRRQACDGPYAYTLNEPNVCVLDMASYQINDQPVSEETEILKIDRAVRTAFQLPWRGGEMVQPWYSKKFAARPEAKGKLRLAFSFEIAAMPSSPVRLALEEAANYAISINEKPLAAAPEGWWVDPAIQTLTLPADVLVSGANTLELTTDFREDMNLEALYLLGDFGVSLAGTQKTLIDRPEEIRVGDLSEQGLPFYSGTVTYHIPVSIKPEEGERIILVTPQFEAACIKPAPDRIIPWPPYESDVTDLLQGTDALDVAVVLTRRNTFGPLHQIPLHSESYGPGNWLTEGNGWSQSYQLYPAGLLEAPFLSVRRAK